MQQKFYLKYVPPKIDRVVTRLMAQEILNIYLRLNESITKLKKRGRLKLNCRDSKKQWQSDYISYDIIRNYLYDNNKFDFNFFKLFEIKCNWLDGNIGFALAQYLMDSDGKVVSYQLGMPFGKNFPIIPRIDREGILHNSLQNPLIQRILKLHKKLVNQSHKILDTDWMYDLISLISNLISIVDITLNQIYIKAEFDPLAGWIFDKSKLGERHGRRLLDKLEWVKFICRNPLDDIESERRSLIILKEIRNHTQHFDPPCFGYTIEDVANWLNMASDIGSLLFKIRKKIGSPINEGIIELILLPEVIFDGISMFNRKRIAQQNSGYITTCWA